MSGDVTGEVADILADNPEMTKAEAWAHAYRQHEGDVDRRTSLAKAAPNASISKMEFEVSTEGSVGAVFKAGDDFVIWGPASVEVVDKEDDRIKASALEDALPQLLKRKRLSYEHSDQIVGDILERFTTDEPTTVEINGKSFERTDFPTDVLKLDGLRPGLYVAGNIYDDTQKSREVRKQIEEDEIDSYSISGEAIVTEMAVKDGRTFTDILKLDLSAVTLCREGMNQKAKFDVVSKGDAVNRSLNPQKAASLASAHITKTMSNGNDDDVQKFVDALDKTLDDRLPDGEIATKGDVEQMVEEKIDEKAQEGSPTDGTPDRPDGDSDSPTNQEDPYEGDSDEWGDNPSEDSDKVEQTKSDTYSREELKSILPDDQFKAIAPVLERAGGDFDHGGDVGDGERTTDPRDDRPEEMVDEEMPDEDPLGEDEEADPAPDPVLASKAVEHLDLNRLPDEQAYALLKAQEEGRLEKTGGSVNTGAGVAGGVQPAHAGAGGSTNEIAKADNEAVSTDPAMRHIYDDDGKPQV